MAQDASPVQTEGHKVTIGVSAPIGRLPNIALLRRAGGAIRAATASRWDRVAVAAIVAGVAIRLVWGLAIHPPFDYVYSDMQGYVDRALRLASGAAASRGDAFYPPGTHLLLAVPFSIFGAGAAGMWAAAALWCALSSLTPLAMWRLARPLLTPAAAALTALLCALWPLHITYGGFFTSETPALALLVAALWLTYRARHTTGPWAYSVGLLAGLCGGAAIVNRPQSALNLLLVALPLLLGFRRQVRAVLGFVAGVALPILVVVFYTSMAAGRPTGISENGGLVFWLGHCDVHDVTTVDRLDNYRYTFGPPPAWQLNRGGSYHFEDQMVWDQAFFYAQGWECIERDGLGHARQMGRMLLDMTATTIPWPQSNDARGERGIVQVANLAYSILLPFLAIGALLLIRRRRAAGQPAGEAALLAHLACLVPLALLYFGDPRYRSPTDVFGLALLAALLAARFGLDTPSPVPGEETRAA